MPRLKFATRKQNSGGFSLVEALVALGLLMMLVAAGGYMVVQSSQEMGRTKMTTDAFNVMQELRAFLSVAQQCSKNFSGLAASPGPVMPIANRIVDTSDNIIFEIGVQRAGEKVTVSGIQFSEFKLFDSSVPNRGVAELRIQVDRPGISPTSWSVPMILDLDAGGLVTNCTVGGAQESLWDLQSDDLVYAGNVGIRTAPELGVPLKVDGSAFFGFDNVTRGVRVQANPAGNIDITGTNYFRIRNSVPTPPGPGPESSSPYGFMLSGSRGFGLFNSFVADSAFFLQSDGWAGNKYLKLESAVVGRGFEIDIRRGILLPPLSDAFRNGLRLLPQDPSQNILFNSRLIVGNGVSGLDFFVDGKAGGTSAWTVVSDSRLKKDIKNLENSLQVIKKMRGVEFEYKKIGEKSIGFIAQEIPSELKSLVRRDEYGLLVSYSEVIPVLVKSVQELQAKNDLVREKIRKLKTTVCRKAANASLGGCRGY